MGTHCVRQTFVPQPNPTSNHHLSATDSATVHNASLCVPGVHLSEMRSGGLTPATHTPGSCLCVIHEKLLFRVHENKHRHRRVKYYTCTSIHRGCDPSYASFEPRWMHTHPRTHIHTHRHTHTTEPCLQSKGNKAKKTSGGVRRHKAFLLSDWFFLWQDVVQTSCEIIRCGENPKTCTVSHGSAVDKRSPSLPPFSFTRGTAHVRHMF